MTTAILDPPTKDELHFYYGLYFGAAISAIALVAIWWIDLLPLPAPSFAFAWLMAAFTALVVRTNRWYPLRSSEVER